MGPELRTIVMQDAENFLRQAQAMKEHGGHRRRRQPGAAPSAGRAPGGQCRRGRPERQAARGPGAGPGLRPGARSSAASSTSPPGSSRRGVPVVAVKVALGGFDTHANQAPMHERLLSLLANGLATFRKNLIAAGRWDDVVRDDLFGVRPARAAERQRRHRSRHGGAAVRDGRQGEGRPARRLAVARRPAGRRPAAHRRLPRRLFDGGQGLLGPAGDFGQRQPQPLGLIA